MSTGYATDDSTGSNKRVRISDKPNAPAAHGGATPDHSKSSSPTELAKATAKAFTASLHEKMRINVVDFADQLIAHHAKWFRKKEAYAVQKNDAEFIPVSARVKVTLDPVEGVAEDPAFKDLARETAAIVQQCRKLLREPLLKVTALNVEKLSLNIQKAFVTSLPKIAELVIAEEGGSDYGEHQAVIDLFSEHADDLLPFVRLREESFEDIYKATHSLATLPTPSRRPATNIAPTPPTARGQAGTRRQATNSNRTGGGGENNGLDISNNAQNRDRERLAAASNAAGALPGRNYAAAAAAAVAATAVEEHGAPVTPAANPAHQDARIVNTIQAITSPSQQQTLQGMSLDQQRLVQFLMGVQFPTSDEVNDFDYESSTDDTNNALVILQGGNPPAAEPPTEDVEMGTEESARNGGGINGTDFSVAADLTVPWARKEYIRRRMLAIIKGAFIKPVLMYSKQVEANERALRIKKVATKQRTVDSADGTAAVLAAEATADPNLVRIMIREETAAAMNKNETEKRKAAAAKKQKQPKQQKNKSGGPQARAASKNKSSHQQANSRKGGAAAKAVESNKGSNGKKQKQGKHSSNNKSRKTKDASKRGRSKSPSASRRT